MIGTTLSHFRITAKLGEGGMGEVYQATDTKLGREVAIKILPRAFTADPERLTRFEREARLLASLNHPQIAAVYETGVVQDEAGSELHFLVLELAEGETLDERLKRGRMAVDEALATALAISRALEAAHEKGIVHRDLKPANVKVAPDGTLKILDFGLAKVFAPEGGGGQSALLSHSPTLTANMTEAGVILGTAAYMSPEQARGREVDRRADVWAFGVLLMEMLSGERLFAGETLTDTLAAVVRAEPSWENLPAETPLAVRRLLERCLEKNPDRRLRDVGEARLVLEDPGPAMSPAEDRRPYSLALLAGIGLASAMLGALVAAWVVRGVGESGSLAKPATAVQLETSLGGLQVASAGLAISPDGTTFYFTDIEGDLYRRRFDSVEPELVARIGGADELAVSPDGRWLAFADEEAGAVKRMATDGGPISVVCPLPGPDGFGVAWADDGTLVFSAGQVGGDVTLYRVESTGGEAVAVTSDELKGLAMAWPSRFPRDAAVLITVYGEEDQRSIFFDAKKARTGILDLAQRRFEPLVEQAVQGRWSSDHLLSVNPDGALIATSLAASPPRSTPLLDGVGLNFGRIPTFDAAEGGTLAYLPGKAGSSQLLWAEGGRPPVTLRELDGTAFDFEISPDGRRIALSLENERGMDIWVFDRVRETLMRQTFAKGARYYHPVWHPDGTRIAFGLQWTDEKSRFAVAVAYVGSSDAPEQIFESEYLVRPTSWSSDGSTLVAMVRSPVGFDDIWAIPADVDGTPHPVFASEFDDDWPALSPDGEWLVYEGLQSGQDEIYVRPYPGPGPEVQVSQEGGTRPHWSEDSRTIFYRGRDGLFSVSFAPGSPPELGLPKPHFVGSVSAGYDVAAGGEQIVFAVSGSELLLERVSIVLNWPALLPAMREEPEE